MKLKLMSMLVGGIVLMTPFISRTTWAQPRSTEPLPIMAGVELTQQQESQLAQIRRQIRTEIENILSTEQRNQFKATWQQGEGLRSAIAAMNLTPEQKTQLREVFQSTRSRFANTLTPEQRQRLRQNLQQLTLQNLR
jgi:Spy/CpxP family protein refolding chaperone